MFNGEKYPVGYILCGIQLLILSAAFSYDLLREGFRQLLRFNPNDYSLCALTLVLTLLYHLALVLLPHEGAPVLCLSPAALHLALLPLAELLDWYRASAAFRVVADRHQKFAMLPRVSVGGVLSDDRMLLQDTDAPDGVRYAYPVGFVRNYRANTERRAQGHRVSLGVPLLLALAPALALGLYVLVAEGSAATVLQTVFHTLMICLPVTASLVTCLPMFWAALLRLRRRSAIIGEVPVHECDGIHTLVIPDGEVFCSMQHEHFEVLEEHWHGKAVPVLVHALLNKLSSPLIESVEIGRGEGIPADRVTLTEIGETGVSALVGAEEIPLLMGDEAYVKSKGIAVRPRSGLLDGAGHGKRLLYVVSEGRVLAFFLARYRLNEDMAELLRDIGNEPIRILVRSRDPGICNALFDELLPEDRARVRVMRPTVCEVELKAENADATVVALGSCREVVRAHVICRRIAGVHRAGDMLRFASMAGGALLSVLLTLLGRGMRLSGVGISMYLLFWCGIYALLSFLRLRGKKG
jgi:hypothetical protein